MTNTDFPHKPKFFISINLSFFNSGEKTEKPTQRKREKARAEGQVAKSPEVNTALLFLVAFFGLRIFSGYMYTSLVGAFTFSLGFLENPEIITDTKTISGYIAYFFGQVMLIVAPVFAICMLIGIISNLYQVGWHPTTKTLKPKFSKLNPLQGVKRLFSMRVVVDLIKSLAKFAVITVVIYSTLVGEISKIPQLVDMGLMQAVIFLGDIAVRLGTNIGLLFLFIAIADVMYTRFKHTKDLMMTKQEVKDEYKNIEGNPQIKGKIKQKMREISMRRMMQNVPQADVVITNPTHYAIALKYDKDVSDAPYVVAKGVDFLAKRIRDKAKENNIEIVENPPLARAIYAQVNIGGTIPPELFQAVAEVLAFVYKLKNKTG